MSYGIVPDITRPAQCAIRMVWGAIIWGKFAASSAGLGWVLHCIALLPAEPVPYLWGALTSGGESLSRSRPRGESVWPAEIPWTTSLDICWEVAATVTKLKIDGLGVSEVGECVG